MVKVVIGPEEIPGVWETRETPDPALGELGENMGGPENWEDRCPVCGAPMTSGKVAVEETCEWCGCKSTKLRSIPDKRVRM